MGGGSASAAAPGSKKGLRITVFKMCFVISSSDFCNSRYIQLAKYTIFDEESDSEVKNGQIERPQAKN